VVECLPRKQTLVVKEQTEKQTKATIKKINSQTVNWEKVFEIHMPEKGFISGLHKEIYMPIIK
jgi:hypothetical protein